MLNENSSKLRRQQASALNRSPFALSCFLTLSVPSMGVIFRIRAAKPSWVELDWPVFWKLAVGNLQAPCKARARNVEGAGERRSWLGVKLT